MARLRSVILSVSLMLFLLCNLPASTASADDLLATPTPTSTAEPTATPMPTARPLPTATRAPEPTAVTRVETTPTPQKHHRRKHRTNPKATSTRTQVTPTRTQLMPTVTPAVEKAHRHRHRKHKKASSPRTPAPTRTPTPLPTATPILNLNTEDTIAPVTCNGLGKAVASHPILMPPFHGWTSIVSYFDHDSPNYLRDGLVITASGAEAKPDNRHVRTDFPAYWNPSFRQYLDYDGHNGYDYDISYQPVYAAAAGTVIFAHMEYPTMPDHGYGNLLMIQHRGGYVTLYGHLSRFLVKKGQHVRSGEQVATSGNTGHSTGPHLHFTVFHNCMPTDPYGWAGGGPDPLSSYAGETSIYLWKVQPAVDNPLPGWPGVAALPLAGVPRMILLRLPSTTRGSDAFTHALRVLGNRVVRALGGPGVASVNILQGTVDTSARLTASQILRIPGVVSITAPDVLDGARRDVLDALARATLSTRHRRLKLSKKGGWTGYLISYGGRTVLVGKGQRGKTVDVRLSAGRGGAATHRIKADPASGAYVIDLGRLSREEQIRLQQQLEKASTSVRTVKSAKAPTHVRVNHRRVAPSKSSTFPAGIALVISLLLALGVALMYYRQPLLRLVRPTGDAGTDPPQE